MQSAQTILADLVWDGSSFVRDVAVHVRADGTIEKFAKPQAADANVTRLPRHALLPGFVNAHSHAFQRGLRSQAQRFDSGAGNFWSWRETMYRLAESLDVESFYETSKQCFAEMLRAGMTSVGEFHYLHHAGEKQWAFDHAIVAAARDAGIRMVLMQTFYSTGAIGEPLSGAQVRFGPISREEFVRQFDRIGAQALACHSIRAVSRVDLKYFGDYAAANDLPFHIHVEEARKEISDCVAAYGANPLKVLLNEIKIDDRVTAIHCTHSTPDDLREFISRGGRICLCPITEGNLSDGFPDVPTIRSAGGKICIGTDSNIRLCMNEELRWLEFAQRLRREQRGIVVDDSHRTAPALMRIGTTNGAESIGLKAGTIAPGNFADLIAVDLDHPSMRGCDEDSLLDSLILGSGNGPIDNVWVGGKLSAASGVADRRAHAS
ncbi:MAG: formimidoylglutamate deiminase [Anaerolineae bacterium]|nr:formimidoylglutamate deiminase [Phycisphaerae bacterium]